jgi:hypothetical protein
MSFVWVLVGAIDVRLSKQPVECRTCRPTTHRTSGVVLKNEVGERLSSNCSKKCNLARILHRVSENVGERRSPAFPPHYTTDQQQNE